MRNESARTMFGAGLILGGLNYLLNLVTSEQVGPVGLGALGFDNDAVWDAILKDATLPGSDPPN